MQEEKHDWYTLMVRKLHIYGESVRTQQAYTREVHQSTVHYNKYPVCITKEQLEEYFLYRRNESE